MEIRNILSDLPESSEKEIFEVLHKDKKLTIERIISNGQTTPDGEWYDQKQDEWILVLQGTGVLQLEDRQEYTLNQGDYLLIEKRLKHRVVHTDPDTIWLAVHLG